MGLTLCRVSQISWSANGTLVAITGDDSFYLLKFDRDAYNAALESGIEITDEGVEEAFELVAEISERSVASFLLPSPWGLQAEALPSLASPQRQDLQVGRRLLHLHHRHQQA